MGDSCIDEGEELILLPAFLVEYALSDICDSQDVPKLVLPLNLLDFYSEIGLLTLICWSTGKEMVVFSEDEGLAIN